MATSDQGLLPTITNTLRVAFPDASTKGLTLVDAYEELRTFGEVATVNLSTPGSVIVSYFDARCALRAWAALGPRCTPEPQQGLRTVRLPQEAQVEAALICDVSSAVREEDGTFVLEFFDTRAAKRVLEVAGLQGLSAAKPMLPGVLANQVDWQALADGRERRTTLCLLGLPQQMCSEGSLQLSLKKAGLWEAVDFVRALRSSTPGKFGGVVVNAVSPKFVPAIVRFFHGREYAATKSAPVRVSFYKVQGLEALHTQLPERPAEALDGRRVPAKIPLQRKCASRQPQDKKHQNIDDSFSETISEVSTDASSEASSELQPLRIVLPPPGLTSEVTLVAA